MTVRRWPWVWLALGITAYDAFLLSTGSRSLSESFALSVRHPVRRWPTILAWTVLTAHLFAVLPRRYDPLHRVAGVLSAKWECMRGTCG